MLKIQVWGGSYPNINYFEKFHKIPRKQLTQSHFWSKIPRKTYAKKDFVMCLFRWILQNVTPGMCVLQDVYKFLFLKNASLLVDHLLSTLYWGSHWRTANLAGIYLFKANSGRTRAMCEIKTTVTDVILVSLLFTLNRFHKLFWCFHH